MGAAIERAKSGRAPRLTRQLIADVVATLQSGTPINWAMEYAGVHRDQWRIWRQRAEAARLMKPGNRSQLDRLAIEFDAQTRQAIAEFGVRAAGQMASASGLTVARPKRRRVTRRVLADEGKEVTLDAAGNVVNGRVIELVMVEEELAPDWRALDRTLARRFHEEYTGNQGIGDGEGPGEAGREVGDEELFRHLEQARDRAGIVPKPIDAVSHDGPAELSATTLADPRDPTEAERG
jgi:hypothetical protein